ncbi:ATP-binding protein (plasmid) [Streptomyces chartreusis]|uniref:ATP-binding protein n=1 Tax=Streptomyces chartreusis TaxID=1969 RepID=UPI002F90B485|nr:ATP-binding protein [Streptomyces chartreusis]
MPHSTPDILVTNHTNFLIGRVHVPLDDGGVERRDVTVEELLLRRAHVVMMDEVDALQAKAFDEGAKSVLLARYGSPSSPVRELEEQFSRHCLRLSREVEEYLHPKIKRLSWLAETYVSHLARGAITPDRERRRLVVPRRWDAMLAHRIFKLKAGDRPSEAHMRTVNRLFSKTGELAGSENVEGLEELRAVLSSLTDLSDDDSLSAGTLAELADRFRKVTADPASQDAGAAGASPKDTTRDALLEDVTDLVQYAARRAFLEKIREILREGTFQPLSTSAVRNRRRQLLFLGEPMAATPNLAVRSGLGSTLFAARRIPVASRHCCYIARQFTRQTVRRWNLHSICDDAVQIASELVANAVRHGRPDTAAADSVQAGVWLAFTLRPRTLLCVVRDPSQLQPRLTAPQPMAMAERHHGLPIVNALSNTWGWTTDAQARGKSVWARVTLPAA